METQHSELVWSRSEKPAFINKGEVDAWLDAWCRVCLREEGDGMCALLTIAICGQTPTAWIPSRKPTSNPALTYHCNEWIARA